MERIDFHDSTTALRPRREPRESALPVDDKERHLIERIERRDGAALGELYDIHSPIVYGLLLQLLGDDGDAQQALQQVFLDFWNDPGGSARRSALATLASIARSVALARRSSRSERRPAADPGIPLMITGPLSALSVDERDLLTRLYFGNRPLCEIAAETNVDAGELRARTVAAMQHLHKVIGNGSGST